MSCAYPCVKGACGMREQAHLVRIEHDRKITRETDCQFLFEYQRAILLSLKTGGLLDEIQYHCAEERLRRQMQGYVRNQNDPKGRGDAL